MKKTLTVLVLLSFILNTYSQVPANRQKEFNAKVLQDKRSIETNRLQHEEKVEIKKTPYYYELKLIKSTKSKSIQFPNINKDEIIDKPILKKVEALEKLKHLANSEYFNIFIETNKINLKLISHSFQIVKDEEIHYYIFEL